jgi:hypothetical protein
MTGRWVLILMFAAYAAHGLVAARARCRRVRIQYPGSRPRLVSWTPRAASAALVWVILGAIVVSFLELRSTMISVAIATSCALVALEIRRHKRTTRFVVPGGEAWRGSR